jgi:hypothetical protein
VTKPIINTEVEYKLVKEALQQDLDDKNNKITKLENANLELINKVNDLMAKNLDLHEKKLESQKSQRIENEKEQAVPNMDSLMSFQRNQHMVKQKFKKYPEYDNKDIFRVNEYDSNKMNRENDYISNHFVSKSDNILKPRNYQNIRADKKKLNEYMADNNLSKRI